MKANSWIAVSFDDFESVGDSDTAPSASNSRKRRRDDLAKDVSSSQPSQLPRTSSKKLSQQPSTDLWVDKYTPKSKEELAVHKKKVADVEEWLQTHLTRSKFGSQFLLLTGPAGSGKTATIKTLAKHHKLEVQEWINPLTDSFISNPDMTNQTGYVSFNFGPRSESQTTQFKDFLLRANKYCSLSLSGEESASKLLLVEEFPNVFLRDPQLFHIILREFRKKSQCPLVFIISDNVGGESNERFLFPKDLQMELQMKNIAFNPVANTMMNKVLQRIVNSESLAGWETQKVAKSTLESLVAASNGDIRAVINALQFSARGGEKKSVSKQKTSKKTSSSQAKEDDSKDDMVAVGGKDTTMFLFRALGKVLYCKRDGKGDSPPESYTLPSHLKHHERDPLQFNPEDVLEKSHISGDFFMAYLHQNYIDFFSSLEDVARAADYLGQADLLSSDWTSRTQLQPYAASVAVRGLIHSNTARASSSSGPSKGLGWKPLHKPQWFSTIRKTKENINMARVYFKGQYGTPVEVQTQYIPFVSLFNRKSGNSVQNRFIQEVGTIKSSRFHRSTFAEKLSETDVDLAQDEDSLPCAPIVINNGEQPQVSQVPEEDVTIEDYDSD